MPQASFMDDPELYAEIMNLMDLVFSGREVLTTAERLGLCIQTESTPFVIRADGHVVSHVGVLSLPLLIDGRAVAAGGIYGVCTHPDYRGRGLCRETMTAATAWCNERFETTLLFTGIPKMYEPHGFRAIQEHNFVIRDVSALKQRGTSNLRRLDWSLDEDVALLKRIAREREPASRVLGVAPASGIFAFNAARLPMWYSHELDTILAMHVEAGVAQIHDVVANRMPGWDELVSLIPANTHRVELCFCPDVLEAEHRVTPSIFPYDGCLMARGPLGDESQPKMLPRTAEF